MENRTNVNRKIVNGRVVDSRVSGVNRKSVSSVMNRRNSGPNRPGTGHNTLNTPISRGSFVRGASAVVGSVIGAGLFGSSVARAVYDEPPYVDYVVPQSDGSVWVYPLNWAEEYPFDENNPTVNSYDWYLPGTIEEYVLNGSSLPNKDKLNIPVVSNNAPNPPAFPIVEIDEGAFIIPCDPYDPECEVEVQEYIFFYPRPDEDPYDEWFGSAQGLYQIVGMVAYDLEVNRTDAFNLIVANLYTFDEDSGAYIPFTEFVGSDHYNIYDNYATISGRLDNVRSEWQTLMGTPETGLWSKYYQWDVKHVQHAIDNYDNVLLKSTTPSDLPMYFYFGQGGSEGIGHVEITGNSNVGRHVTISGEPGNITLPNNVTMPGGMASRSTIYGGGTEIEAGMPVTGAISMQLENPYGPSDQYGNPTPTGFNLTVDNVHLDHFQIIGINVEASRDMVEIKNCVFSNPVQGLNWGITQAMNAVNTPRVLFGKDDNGNWILPRFLNGEIVVKDCLFELENSAGWTIAIEAWDSETLTKFKATGNTIHAFNELSWISSGISCRGLTKINPNNNPTVEIYDNPLIQASLNGITVEGHIIEGRPGYAKITGNTIEMKGNLFEGHWSDGIDVIDSDAGALIFDNDITLNGWVGAGITPWKSSNCIIRKNRIKTGDMPIGPLQQSLCKFGISADGESREGRFSNNNHIGAESDEDGNKLKGNFEFGMFIRDADGCIFEHNDLSQAICYNIWPAIDPFFNDPAVILGTQLAVGHGTTNGQFRNNKFGQVYTVYDMDWEAGLDMSSGVLNGPTVYIGQSWFHVFFEGYVNEYPLSNIYFDGNDYMGTGLPGWKAIWASPGVAELIDVGCIFVDFNSKKIIFNEILFPSGTTACNQILDLGSANRIYDEQNKNLNCNKFQDTSILRQFFNDHRASIEKHEYRAWELGKGIPGLLHGIYPHWPKYPYETE